MDILKYSHALDFLVGSRCGFGACCVSPPDQGNRKIIVKSSDAIDRRLFA